MSEFRSASHFPHLDFPTAKKMYTCDMLSSAHSLHTFARFSIVAHISDFQFFLLSLSFCKECIVSLRAELLGLLFRRFSSHSPIYRQSMQHLAQTKLWIGYGRHTKRTRRIPLFITLSIPSTHHGLATSISILTSSSGAWRLGDG